MQGHHRDGCWLNNVGTGCIQVQVRVHSPISLMQYLLIRAPGVELPEQPEMDYSDYSIHSQNDSIFKVDSFGPSSWGQSPAQQAFEVKQVEYGECYELQVLSNRSAKIMENPSIWHAAGVERKVFDQKVSLEAPKGTFSQ